MSIVFAYDATGANVNHLPKGQACGYTTGFGSVPWSAAQFAAHPGVVRIDQDPAASDHTADVLDVERGAATLADCAPWYKAALASFDAVKRPGQRRPAIYTSMSNVSAVANALIAGGVTSGPKLWIADWNDAVAADEAAVNAAGGPWPIVGYQFKSGQFYDYDLFSGTWLGDVSKKAQTGPFRHVLNKETLAAFAAGRGNASVSEMLADTAAAYTKTDAGTLINGLIVYTDVP